MKLSKQYKAAYDENIYQLFKHTAKDQFVVVRKDFLKAWENSQDPLPAIELGVSKLGTLFLTNSDIKIRRENYVKVDL